LWYEQNKRDKNKIFHELLRFSIKGIGFIPQTELHMVWNGMSEKNGLPFFGPVMGGSKEMLNRIQGMAWDMTILRNIERSATMNGGNFFIPYFVSLDRRLRDLIRFSPVKLILIDDKNKRVIFIRNNEVKFQEALRNCMRMDDVRHEMEPSKIEGRQKFKREINFETMRNLVVSEEEFWKK